MYTQFFGNYLLQQGVVNQEQLLKAISRLSETKLKLGTIAMSEGYMTASEADECLYMQTREDKRFGEIAVERGYLTEEQVNELLEKQMSDFLLLGQTLVEDGVFTNADLERLIFDYQADTELYDLEFNVENREKIKSLISKFFWTSEIEADDKVIMYLELLYNSLIRFIGEDFTPLTPMSVSEYPFTFMVSQKIIGSKEYTTYIDMDRETAIEFAKRYASMDFDEFNDYVVASVEDFMNLHNGLYLVNASNYNAAELSLEPPEMVEGDILKVENTGIVLPVAYTFGKINLIVCF